MRIGQGAVPSVDVTDRTARDLGFAQSLWLRRIRIAGAFARGVKQGGAAGVFSHVQLFNPVASLVTVIVWDIWYTVGGQIEIRFSQDNVARATLAGTGINLDSGSAAAVAEVRSENNAAQQGTLFSQFSLPTQDVRQLNARGFMQLGAGEGLSVIGDSVNTTVDCFFAWIEL